MKPFHMESKISDDESGDERDDDDGKEKILLFRMTKSFFF